MNNLGQVGGEPRRGRSIVGALVRVGMLTCFAACLVTPASAQRISPKSLKQLLKPSQTTKAATEPLWTPVRDRVASEGTYVEGGKQSHKWSINAEHALIWDGAPYLPVGGTFAPRSFVSDDPSAWKQDQAALAAIKQAGVDDIVIWPPKPLVDIPGPTVQRLLDYLNASGFRFGVEFGVGMTTPLTGTLVEPGAYRYADTKDNLTANWHVADSDNALFILTDIDDDNKILGSHSFPVPVESGAVSVPIDAPVGSGRLVAILYPHKALPARGDGDMPGMWRGFDAYRDRSLAALAKLKFGPGLRFFLDPLARHIGMLGDSGFIVPDSPEFRIEWEGYLTRRYANRDDLRLAWSMNEGDLKEFREFATLTPLWSNGRGVPYFYDPIAHRQLRITDATQSHWWSDFQQFRTESASYYLNAMARVLKGQVADVPVVVTWTQPHTMFSDTDTSGGVDGLAIAALAHSGALVSRTAGPAYSAAEHAKCTTWLLATEVAGAPPVAKTADASAGPRTVGLSPNAPPTAIPGYQSQASLTGDLNWMRRVGFKGFFASALQADDAQIRSGVAEWLRSPDSIGWLAAYRPTFSGTNAADFAPSLLYYPQLAPGPARCGPVPGSPDVIWLPTYTPGEYLDWWPAYRGYILQTGDPKTDQTVLVSTSGRRVTHLWAKDAKAVHAFNARGQELQTKLIEKGCIELTLDESPTVFVTGGQPLIPQEAATDVVAQLRGMIGIAKEEKLPSAQSEDYALERARIALGLHEFDTVYSFARASLENLISEAQPYIWIEGENAAQHTFGEVAAHVEASNGRYLRLSTASPPGHLGYAARYLFDVPTNGKYDIWIACTTPGPNTSPIRWRINSEQPQAPAETEASGLYLSDRLGWIRLGRVPLERGPGQSLTIYVTDRASATQQYVFSIDSILITQHAFHPNGTVRPLPIDPDQLKNAPKIKESKPRRDVGLE